MRVLTSCGHVLCDWKPDKSHSRLRSWPPPLILSFLQVQKKKIWEAVQPLLRVNAQGVATVAGETMVTSAGPLTAPSLVDAAIS